MISIHKNRFLHCYTEEKKIKWGDPYTDIPFWI